MIRRHEGIFRASLYFAIAGGLIASAFVEENQTLQILCWLAVVVLVNGSIRLIPWANEKQALDYVYPMTTALLVGSCARAFLYTRPSDWTSSMNPVAIWSLTGIVLFGIGYFIFLFWDFFAEPV